MRHAAEIQHRIMRDHAGAGEEEKLRLLTQYNVLAQIEHLKSHPACIRASSLAKWRFTAGSTTLAMVPSGRPIR